MKNSTLYLGATAIALSLGGPGCGGDPIEGTWESDFKVDGHRNEFTVISDGGELVGDGAFWFTIAGSVVRCTADLEVEVRRDREYSFTARWSGSRGCDLLQDTDGDCELYKDDTELDCGGDGIYNLVED